MCLERAWGKSARAPRLWLRPRPKLRSRLRLLLLRGAPAQLRRIASLDLTGVRLRSEGALLGLLPVRMPRLRALWLRGTTVDTALLAALGAGLPRLSLLSLGGCRGVSDASLLALLGALPAA
jgi:hypothetical protein